MPPAPITFDAADPLHAEFITALADLRAAMFGLPPVLDKGQAAAAADQVPVQSFRPAEGGFCVTPVVFDKDVDAHMRVVAAVSNLRARNYSIREADLHTSRGIAGKITPAIATTTAMVTGKEWKWTQWDRVDVSDPQMTVEGLIAMLDAEYSVELSMLSSGVTILYSDFMDRKKMAARKVMTLREVVESVTKKSIPAAQKYLILELIVNDVETGDEVEIPYLRFKLFA
ncbi:ubiquitin-activating enzyme e1 C-terminal domain-containing protein [Ochromonadaceae sp. CCMP2298]|nr:ubiquitin-activating enzyme e1 C-terminal domain-containing protein [Ochromonadaceae sp. CCMP2298]